MYHKNDSIYSHSTPRSSPSNYHISRRSYQTPDTSNYMSSYLVRKGPKKIEEPSRDYNFEEYFRILPPHLYSRYYDSHKILNQGKRFFPNLRLNLNRGLNTFRPSSAGSSLVSTPSSAQFSPRSRPTSPHFNYELNDLDLNRAKSPISRSVSRPLSPISIVNNRQLSSPPPFQSSTLSSQLPSKTAVRKSTSSHSIRTAALTDEKKSTDKLTDKSTDKSNDKSNDKSTDKPKDNKTDNESKDQIEKSNKNLNKSKTKSHQALNDNCGDCSEELNDQNLIRILSQNIIELTENLNSFLNEHKIDSSRNDLNKTKSSETLKDNDFIEKIDQLREVSEKLKDCTKNVNKTADQNVDQKNVDLIDQLNQQKSQQQTKLANQLNVAEQIDSVNVLDSNNIEPEFAECRSFLNSADLDQDKVQVNQQTIIEPTLEQVLSNENENYDLDKSQFNEENKDKKIKQINKLKQDKLKIEKQLQQESQEDEFFECTNDEQKGLRKSLFKGSKLNLDQVINKAIEEQLLGQWLKLSDSLDSEDGTVQQKNSVDELKHKFATKLAIIHYKLYQKYSKTRPIKNVRKSNHHRKLYRDNKIQSKYTLLQGLMDDNQFIQFLMDKINYFMRKLKQSKTQKKELKKNLDRIEEQSKDDKKLQTQLEFDKGSLKDETIDDAINKLIDENNNECDKLEDKLVLDENNNIIREELDKLNEIKDELKNDAFKESLDEEIIKKLDEELSNERCIKEASEMEALKTEEDLSDILNDEDDDEDPKKRSCFSKYALLFIFTLIVFMMLIVLFRSFTLFTVPEKVKKQCTNCVKTIASQDLVLKPVDAFNQLNKFNQLKFPPCDQRILLESQKLLGSTAARK